jgi:hypothetical protein
VEKITEGHILLGWLDQGDDINGTYRARRLGIYLKNLDKNL